MKRGFVLGVLVAVGGLSMAVAGFQDPAQGGRAGRGGGRGAPMEGLLAADAGQWKEGKQTRIYKLRDNIYRINNTGSNLTAFVTGAGVVIVESGYAGWGPDVLAKIKSVTDQPLTMVINTHAHADHAAMNPELGRLAGHVEFVASDHAKKMMSQADCTTLSGAGAGACTVFKGDNAQYLPSKTVKDKLSLKLGNLPIELAYYGPAHTAGDIVITFPTLGMAHVGDLFAWQGVPRLFGEDGGSTIQFPETLRKAQAGTRNVTSIITGHSLIMTFQDWVDQRMFVTEYVDQLLALHKAGKTVEETVAAIKFAPKWNVCPQNDTFASQYPEDYAKFHMQCNYRTDQLLTDTKYAYAELNKK